MFFHAPRSRSIKQLLRDKTGTGIAESLVGISIVLVIISAIGTAVVQDMSTVSVVATKAERQAFVTSLVGDKHAMATWGTSTTPHTETMTLPNGHELEVTTWREDSATSTTLTAVAPITSGDDAADCTTPAALAKTGCLYASRVHADDLDSLEPHAIVRADPTGADAAGTVDPHVTTDTAIPQSTVFASGQDDTATVWRYLVNARSLSEHGEIRISQQGKTLAIVPIDNTAQNYFGTFTVTLNVPVVATVTSGDAVVKTVFFYRAGSTS